MTEKITSLSVPALNDQTYEVSDNTWQALRAEILRLKALIQAGTELEPKDVKHVKALAKQVRDYGVLYRRAITTAANDYKNALDRELVNLGYGEIEAYIEGKRQEQQREISDRLSAKIGQFNDIVHNELAQTQMLKSSSIANYVGNNLLTRFPKINSGAASKQITNWNPIESVVHMSIAAADNVLVANPILQRMPATSKAMRSISDYLATGDVHKIENIHQDLMDDRPVIQRMALEPRVQTDEATVDEIQSVLNTADIDAKTKLERIQLLLQVHSTIV